MKSTQFFVTGGALQADAGCYVPRAADYQLIDALESGEFCYVLTSRQMGKSSLMVRAAAELRQRGCAVVILDLTAVGQNLVVDQWYFSLLCHVGERLNLEAEMEAFWDANQRRAPLHRFMGALREVYLERKRKPLIIFVDEIDAVRSLKQFSADEFFAGIRECYNRRPEDPKLDRLTFCLLGVATPSDLIRDQRITPFNIGKEIELRDFTQEEATVLAGGLSPHHDTAQTLLAQIMSWTSGQPYLTQELCAEVAKLSATSVDEVDAACTRVFLSAEARERDDNLHFVRDRILRSEEDRAALLDTYAKVYRGERVHDDHLDPVINELRLSGIVRVEDGILRLRNRIYAKVFDRAWIKRNLPDAEKLRQRAAYYRGIRRVAGVAIVVLAIIGALAVNAIRNGRQAQFAFTQAQAALKAAETATKNKLEADQKLLREARRTEAALDRIVETQAKIAGLLEALTPLVGNHAGKAILDRAEDVVRSATNQASDDPRVIVGLAGLHRVCGRLYLRLGNVDMARKQAEEARRLVEEQLAKGNADPAVKKQLHESLVLLGDSFLAGRKLDSVRQIGDADYSRAMAVYQQSIALSNQESHLHPEDASWRNLYFSDLNYLGDTAQLFIPQRAKEAEGFYKDALSKVREMRSNRSAAPDLDRIEAAIHDRLGTLYLAIARDGEARNEFDNGLKLTQTSSESGLADDPERQNELAVSLNKLGNVFKRQGKNKEALDYYEKSLAIRRKLSEQNKQRDWQRNLEFSLHNVARTVWELGWQKDASLVRRAFDLAHARLDLAERLMAEDPSDDDLKKDLANALYDCADFFLNVSDNSLRDWPRGLDLAQRAVNLTEKRDPKLLALLAQALRFAKRPEEALQTAEEANKLLPAPDKRTLEERDVAKEIAYETIKNRSAAKTKAAGGH